MKIAATHWRIGAVAMACAAGLVLAGQWHDRPPRDSAAGAAEVRSITPAAARGLLSAGAVLVDVRTEAELRRTGMLKGALHVPMPAVGRWGELYAQAHSARPLILYCASGRRARIAAETLSRLGFTKLHNLGGFSQAAASGLPVEQWPNASPSNHS